MEILIPGLILVVLMAYASTKIKKRAAAAWEPELIDTDRYTIQKPEGFLHVVNDTQHEFRAYSREFGEDESASARRATIELDVVNADLNEAADAVRKASSNFEERDRSTTEVTAAADESANQFDMRAFYKLIAAPSATYKLRFAVLPEHEDEYMRRIDDTLNSFVVKSA